MDLSPGSIEKRSYYLEEAQCQMEYAVFVPKSYRGDREAPLVVLLHGLFSNPHQVIRYRGVTSEAEKHGYIVVAPFGFNDRGWYGSLGKTFQGARGEYADRLGQLSENDVLNVLRIVRQEFNIDSKRIYLMGHSMGAAGTLHLGSKFPQLWAALAPLSPPVIAEADIHTRLRPMQHIPVMVVTGSKDFITPVDPVRRLVSTMKALDMDCEYNEIQGGGHSVPAFNAALMAQIFNFFQTRRRDEPAPMVIRSDVVAGTRQAASCKEQSPGQSHSTVQEIKAPPPRRRSWVMRMFRVLGALTSRSLQVELFAWNLFYLAKSWLSKIS